MFTRTRDGLLTGSDSDKDQLAERLFAAREPIPFDARQSANADLAEAAKRLSFDSGKNYSECAAELTRRRPWFRLGTQPFTEGKAADYALAAAGVVVAEGRAS
jgi:hypothetical protein